MIELKEGLGGHGLQPYDTVTGKWITVNVFLGEKPLGDFDGFKNAYLDMAGKSQMYHSIRSDDPRKKGIDDTLYKFYVKALQSKIDAMNEEAVEGEYQAYDTVEDMCKDIGRFFSKELFSDMLEGKEVRNCYGAGIPGGTMKKWKLDLHEKRFGRVKFKSVTKKEFDYMAKQSGAVILYRGLANLPSQAMKDKIFEGFTRNGEGLSKTLMADGSNGKMIGSGIYMSENINYSVGIYTGGSNALIRCVCNSNDSRTVSASEIDNIRKKIRENPDFKKVLSEFVSPEQVDDVQNILLRDNGIVAMLMGIDRVRFDSDVSTVINPNKMYCCNEWEGN